MVKINPPNFCINNSRIFHGRDNEIPVSKLGDKFGLIFEIVEKKKNINDLTMLKPISVPLKMGKRSFMASLFA